LDCAWGFDMTEALIRTVKLTKDHRQGGEMVHALRGITLEIQRGDFVAIMGPSGSGKSTLMNLLGFLDRPTSGQYWFEGRDVSALGTDALATNRRHKIGFVFQNFNLLGRSSAIENVELPLIYSGMGKAERHRKATTALKAVGIAHRRDHWPHQLSGGEQQRVAIARATVNSPALILADEPTGALDSLTSQGVLALFQLLNRFGMTVVVVTHDQKVGQHASRIVTLEDGRMVGDERLATPIDAAVELPMPPDLKPATAAKLTV
jgi:putative ABC transport system ATP-binding protein